MHALLRDFGLVRQVMTPYFARFGVSGAQWGILRVLRRAQANGETSLRLAELGQRLLIQPSGITGLVDRMERQGLVKRSRSKQDLRARCVNLTPAGCRLVATVLQGHSRQIEWLFAAMKPAELERLRELLTRLGAHLQTLTPRRRQKGSGTHIGIGRKCSREGAL